MYVHANAGCRLEALSVLGPCLQMGFQVIALDCAGSGLSGGEHTTLGWRERDDVRAVIDAEDCGQVTLWGRSMGAATALLYAATRDPDVVALILDSPFQSLRQFALDVVQAALGGSELNGAARVASIGALRLVRGAVRRRAGFTSMMGHRRHARECGCPTLVLCALDDALVPPAHSHAVHAALPGTLRHLPRDAQLPCGLAVCPNGWSGCLREHVFGEVPASSGDVEGLLDEGRRLADNWAVGGALARGGAGDAKARLRLLPGSWGPSTRRTRWLPRRVDTPDGEGACVMGRCTS